VTSTLVWVDAREAVIVRWEHDHARIERLGSDVPAHRRSSGGVRHDPARHGGGVPSTAGEPHRLEHLARFIERVADRLPAEDDLLILGPGTVREHLERHVREADDRHGRTRAITSAASGRRTEPQLVARLRAAEGTAAPRRTVGAYRWAESPGHRASGEATIGPRRVLEKPPGRGVRQAAIDQSGADEIGDAEPAQEAPAAGSADAGEAIRG
jgi:hypothetical protein